jgi:hypothetical protein
MYCEILPTRLTVTIILLTASFIFYKRINCYEVQLTHYLWNDEIIDFNVMVIGNYYPVKVRFVCT